MDSATAGAASSTYQCVVCQSTCLTPNELHRHQSYRHTSEELSLSIIGVHNAAIRTFDLPNGIVYDNSWLYDPNRHAQFYTYSANMLCDDNNNGGVVDYAFKTFEDQVVQESSPTAVPDKEDCTLELDRCIDEKYENENLVEAQNFEQESWVGESKILDLRLKIDLEVQTETRMDTVRDNFWGCGEGHSGDAQNLGTESSKSAPSETCVKSQNFEKLQTYVPDGLASQILDLGRQVFSETRTDTVADDFGISYEGLKPSCDSANLGRDIDEKSKNLQIETCIKVHNFDEPQTCVQDFEILDLSQKLCAEVRLETYMDTAADSFGGNLKGESGKHRSSPNKFPAKTKARKLAKPRKKQDSPKRGAAKLETTKNRDSGNVDSAKRQSQDSQDSLSWFESETLKIKKFNNKIKQIRAAQKKALHPTRGPCKEVKGEGSGKTKKRIMQSCGRENTIRLSGNFDSEDFLGFDGKGATINAAYSRNTKRQRVTKKKEKTCKTEADKSVEEAAKQPKKQREEETAGETEINLHSAEHNSIISPVQSLFDLTSNKPKIHATTSATAEKPRVSKEKGKISETEVDSSADETAELLKQLFEEETAGETLVKLNQDNGNGNCSEHSSIFSSHQHKPPLERKKSKVYTTTSKNAKKPKISKKKGNTIEIEADNSADEIAELLKALLEDEPAEETQITQNQDKENGNRVERSAIFASAESTFRFAIKEPKIDVASPVNAKNPVASKRKAKNLESPPKEPAKRESSNPVNRNCEKEIDPRPNWNYKSKDSPACLDTDRPKINAMCAENTKAQAEKTAENKPVKPEGIEATKNDANKNSVNEPGFQPNWDFESPDFLACSIRAGQKITAIDAGNAGAQLEKSVADEPAEQETTGANKNGSKQPDLQPNWDFDSPDFLVCSDGDGQKINATHAENPGAQTENTAAEVTGEVLRDLLTAPSKEETLRRTEKLQNQDYENGNCAEQSSVFGSRESTVRFYSEEAKIAAFASGSAKKPIASKRKVRDPETVADKPTQRETTKPANQNCAKEVGRQPKWDFETPDFLACSDGDGQSLNASRAEKAAVEVTAELLRDLLTEPSEEETPRITENRQNEDCGNEVYTAQGSFLSSDEYLYYFPSEEAKMAAMSSGYAKKPIASGKKSRDLKTVTGWPAKKKMTRKIASDGNGNSSKQYSSSSPGVFSYTGSGSEKATSTPPIASGKKTNDLKTATVWAAKQKMTRKIASDGNGNSSKQYSSSSRDVFSYTGSESEEAMITPLSKFRAERSRALGTKPKKMNAGVENCAEHNPNFVPKIYTCTGSSSKQVPAAGKPKERQVANKKSTNSETVSDKAVVKKTARQITKLFYQDFGSEMFVSQNSPPLIYVNSSTESGDEKVMPKNSPAGNFEKSIVARNKPKNLKVEPALRENSENREDDNVISLYKNSSPMPGGSSACDNELPPVTFVAYPPYVDENSILVLNPESRELIWRCLEPEDSQLDETANFHWLDRGSHRNFAELGKATKSRNGSSASNEESTLQKTNSVRRSTRRRKVIQRYNS